MCGRFALSKQAEELVGFFGVDEIHESAREVAPSYNVAPTDKVLMVAERDGIRKLGGVQWGLVPFWAKDASGSARLINVRVETIIEKPSYKRSFAKRRCLLPADGYFEWKREGSKKQPYFFHAEDEIVALAGMWEAWRDPSLPEDAPLLRSCTVITTTADATVREFHDRMPVVLERELWDAWLDPEYENLAELQTVISGGGNVTLESYPVSTEVNKVGNNRPELLDAVDAD